MRIQVTRVNIPAMSTIGYGWGIADNGDRVEFVGDHRPMRHLGEAVQANSPKPTYVEDLEDWQIQRVTPAVIQ